MKKALIVVDLQNDYFSGGRMELEGIDDALIHTNALIDFAKKANYSIYFVQHFATQEEAPFFIPNTHGVELHQDLDTESGTIIEKNYPNSFRDTNLKEALDQENIRDLIICGAMTHICIDATVRAGFDLGYTMTVPSDACATRELQFQENVVSAKDVQHGFMGALSSFFCDVQETKHIIN